MPSKVKNKLAQLAKVERYISRHQQISTNFERALKALDHIWKDGYEAGSKHQAIESKPVDNKIRLTINKPVGLESEKIQQLSLQLSTRESELDQAVLETAEAKQKLLDQAKRHQQRVDELLAELIWKSTPVGESLSGTYSGHIVENWRDSWKWISNWCFGLIVFFATTPIPPEVLAVLPENVRYYFIAFTAFCGFVGRYINQSKPVALPPINAGDADV